MATAIPADNDVAVSRLRELSNEVDLETTTFPPQRMTEILTSSTTLEGAAAKVWELKAAGYADLVDVQEGSSNRKLSALHKNALAMSAYYAGLTVANVDDPPKGTRTRAIERA